MYLGPETKRYVIEKFVTLVQNTTNMYQDVAWECTVMNMYQDMVWEWTVNEYVWTWPASGLL